MSEIRIGWVVFAALCVEGEKRIRHCLFLRRLELMGGKSSKEDNWEQGSSYRSSSSSSWSSYPQAAYDGRQPYVPQQSYPAEQYYIPPPQNYGQDPYATSSVASDNRNKLERRYSRIADNYNSVEQVRDALIYFLLNMVLLDLLALNFSTFFNHSLPILNSAQLIRLMIILLLFYLFRHLHV